MGLYDHRIDAFADIREIETVKTVKGKSLGKYGLDPLYVEPVEKVAQHILNERKTVLNPGAKRARVGPTWRHNIQRLLKGETQAGVAFTPGQLCDLYSYAIQDSFWRSHVNDPAGLVKHGHKLWLKPEYRSWSIKNGRPEENRPQGSDTSLLKGSLAADYTSDYSDWDSDWSMS